MPPHFQLTNASYSAYEDNWLQAEDAWSAASPSGSSTPTVHGSMRRTSLIPAITASVSSTITSTLMTLPTTNIVQRTRYTTITRTQTLPIYPPISTLESVALIDTKMPSDRLVPILLGTFFGLALIAALIILYLKYVTRLRSKYDLATMVTPLSLPSAALSVMCPEGGKTAFSVVQRAGSILSAVAISRCACTPPCRWHTTAKGAEVEAFRRLWPRREQDAGPIPRLAEDRVGEGGPLPPNYEEVIAGSDQEHSQAVV